MKDDLYSRSKTLSTTCLKIALVLPAEIPLCNLIRGHLVDSSAKLAVKAKGLMTTQAQQFFLQKLSDAKEAADACTYWLELVQQEKYLESHIIDPILEESESISHLFALAIRKIGPNDY
ncbi:hypothetical protein GYB22_09225 [bacterium]|nr:hypothetical protein [bacterium]